MSRSEPAHPVASAPAGDLAQLVAMEQDLEQRLARAREEAHALVDRARRESEEQALTSDMELTALRADRLARLELEKKEEEGRIRDAGRTRAAWYDRLPEAVEETLAAFVIDRLLARERP